MTHPSKRTLALRALRNSRKKLKTINSEPNPESDQESEIKEPPINIPDLPKLENDDAFTTLRNNTRDLDWKDTHLSYQRDHQPSRQTLWRQKQHKNKLQTDAVGSRDIRSMFNVPERSGDFFRTRDGIITQQSAEVYPMYEHARYCFCLRNIFMSQLSIAGRGCR